MLKQPPYGWLELLSGRSLALNGYTLFLFRCSSRCIR
jgi:hypothetical protein